MVTCCLLLYGLKWQPTPAFLPRESCGRAAVHRVAQKSQTRLKRLSTHACIGEGNGNPLQCSCLENPRDGGAWWAAIYGVAQSQTQLRRLSSSSTMYPCWTLYEVSIWHCDRLSFVSKVYLTVPLTSNSCNSSQSFPHFKILSLARIKSIPRFLLSLIVPSLHFFLLFLLILLW